MGRAAEWNGLPTVFGQLRQNKVALFHLSRVKRCPLLPSPEDYSPMQYNLLSFEQVRMNMRPPSQTGVARNGSRTHWETSW